MSPHPGCFFDERSHQARPDAAGARDRRDRRQFHGRAGRCRPALFLDAGTVQQYPAQQLRPAREPEHGAGHEAQPLRFQESVKRRRIEKAGGESHRFALSIFGNEGDGSRITQYHAVIGTQERVAHGIEKKSAKRRAMHFRYRRQVRRHHRANT